MKFLFFVSRETMCFSFRKYLIEFNLQQSQEVFLFNCVRCKFSKISKNSFKYNLLYVFAMFFIWNVIFFLMILSTSIIYETYTFYGAFLVKGFRFHVKQILELERDLLLLNIKPEFSEKVLQILKFFLKILMYFRKKNHTELFVINFKSFWFFIVHFFCAIFLHFGNLFFTHLARKLRKGFLLFLQIQ